MPPKATPKPATKAAAKPAAKAAAKPAAKAAAKPAEKKVEKKAAPAAGAGNGVYVKGLGDANVAAVTELFAHAGKVTDVRLRRNKFALVFFENAAAVKKAVDTMNGKEVKGTAISVAAAKAAPKVDRHQNSSVVFASPLFGQNSTRKAIRGLFAAAGKIVKLRTYRNNSAFVYFENAAAAQKAVSEKNGQTFQGKKLLVKLSARSMQRDATKEAERKKRIAAKKH